MNYRNSYYLTHPWLIVKECTDNVRYFIQRGLRGYSDQDVWSLDYYISSWLPKALRQLKDETPGFPWKDGMTDKKWKKYLEDMAQGFESMDDVPMKQWSKVDNKRRKQRELFAFWLWSLWS